MKEKSTFKKSTVGVGRQNFIAHTKFQFYVCTFLKK